MSFRLRESSTLRPLKPNSFFDCIWAAKVHMIDLPSDTIYEYGHLVGSICDMQ